MIYWFDEKSKLQVMMTTSVLNSIIKTCIEAYPNECGGILIGKYLNQKRAKIRRLMISKKSHGDISSFFRESKEANILLKRIWKKSYGSEYFIGEWHSHPRGSGFPSLQDDTSMFKIAKSKQCSCSYPILVILCGGPRAWQLDRCWVYSSDDKFTLMLKE